jgi:hypothetical protein
MNVDLVEKRVTCHIALVTEAGPSPGTASTNVDDILSIDWDSIDEFLCDGEDDDLPAVAEVVKHCRPDRI